MPDNAKLVCPYTGRRMSLEFDSDTRRPGFYASGGLDPDIPFLDIDDAVLALSMRHGRAVKKASADSLKCAYSGAKITLDYRRGLWHPAGDFVSPARRYAFKEQLIWDLTQRPGKKPGFARDPKMVVTVEREAPQPNPFEDQAVGGAATQEAVEAVLQEVVP